MKLNKLTYFAVVAFLLPTLAFAAEPTIADCLNEQGTVTVEQPEALNARLRRGAAETVETSTEEVAAIVSTPKVKAGYRIQVFDDNNVRTAKHDAQARKNQIESQFPEWPVYVTFNSPYWRVKVGDFKSRGEAESALAEIRRAFPSIAKSLRIVRDRINHQ